AARLLGRRTADLHHALAQTPDDPSFARESFSKLYQRSLYQSMRNLSGRVLADLRNKLDDLPEALQPVARRVLDARDTLHRPALELLPERIDAIRIRTHGDFHLGQVLYTGKDFMIT